METVCVSGTYMRLKNERVVKRLRFNKHMKCRAFRLVLAVFAQGLALVHVFEHPLKREKEEGFKNV